MGRGGWGRGRRRRWGRWGGGGRWRDGVGRKIWEKEKEKEKGGRQGLWVGLCGGYGAVMMGMNIDYGLRFMWLCVRDAEISMVWSSCLPVSTLHAGSTSGRYVNHLTTLL